MPIPLPGARRNSVVKAHRKDSALFLLSCQGPEMSPVPAQLCWRDHDTSRPMPRLSSLPPEVQQALAERQACFAKHTTHSARVFRGSSSNFLLAQAASPVSAVSGTSSASAPLLSPGHKAPQAKRGQQPNRYVFRHLLGVSLTFVDLS